MGHRGRPAVGLGYFHERGLTDDVIRKYQLGYSPEKGSPLAKALKKQGFRDEYILNNVDTKVGTVSAAVDNKTTDSTTASATASSSLSTP